MAGDWFRPSLIDLIDNYKQNENLYNPKHPLYYNKQARKKSLEIILEAVQKTRKESTIQDIHKKIQSLRTQIGQELQKIEKSKTLGDESLVYTPRIWWFPRFEFITSYMKMRSDPTTPLSVKFEQSSFNSSSKDGENETHFFEVVERTADNNEEFEENLEEPDEEEQPTVKKRRVNDTRTTIEYIINDDVADLSTNDQQYVEVEREASKQAPIDVRRHKRRSMVFGKYVGTLMRDLTDDKIFYETQGEILKIIEKAAKKTNQRKS